jgi:hypothetical protein
VSNFGYPGEQEEGCIDVLIEKFTMKLLELRGNCHQKSSIFHDLKTFHRNFPLKCEIEKRVK